MASTHQWIATNLQDMLRELYAKSHEWRVAEENLVVEADMVGAANPAFTIKRFSDAVQGDVPKWSQPELACDDAWKAQLKDQRSRMTYGFILFIYRNLDADISMCRFSWQPFVGSAEFEELKRRRFVG